MSSILIHHVIILIVLVALAVVPPSVARKRHVVDFRAPNLFPESHVWDQSEQHFVVGSWSQRSIYTVSDAGVVETLIVDTDLADGVIIAGLAIDSVNRRLIAVIHSEDPLPSFDALAAYDLKTRKRLFLVPLLDSDASSRPLANDVAVDFNGNAYVTNAAGNFIWKITINGESSILSKSPTFTSQKVDEGKPWSFCGLNGIAYVNKGYLLVVQSNTGKMFKVDVDDGKARRVLLPVDLVAADGIAIRNDGVVVVVSHHKAWLLKSQDSWAEGVVYDEIPLDVSKFASSVTIREDNKAYVLYGHIDEAVKGNVERETFRIEEIESKKDNEEENIWMFVLIGLGLAYVMYWRFQMGQLVKNMNKKTN
ncbi:hypothetical protein Scep_023002 [Stephania cephalantha]|uniref:SMP-30/Gluconolactonase/LRE-like region domain-containing protein n=1 Tax=Stephania cephalantha TaxID=152367 RepID=A0AAP0FC19_9MAGN